MIDRRTRPAGESAVDSLRTYSSAHTSKPFPARRITEERGCRGFAALGAWGASTLPPQFRQAKIGLAAAYSAFRCCRQEVRAALVGANHFGWLTVMVRIRGQAATCHRRLNGSTMKPVPAAAIVRNSLSLTIFRAVSMQEVSRSSRPNGAD